jgi:undecaprenyl-diphosphatase
VNYHLFQILNGAAGRVDAVDDVMEFAATWLIFLIFGASAVLAGAALVRRRVRPVLRLAATLLLAFAGTVVLSHLSDQVRPFQTHHVHQLIAHDPGVSLPSDHATAAFALAFGVYAFLHRAAGLVLGLAALAVGVARVWVGVHYPGDILAAAVLAGLAVLVVAALARRQRQRADGGRRRPALGWWV